VNRGLSTIGLAALLAAGIAGGIGLAARFERKAGFSPETPDSALVLQSAFNRAASIAKKAVVHITIGEGHSTDNVGSGVIVSPKGYIVTNNHVVREDFPCRVRFVDGSEYVAVIRGRDPDSDLAVLEIDAKGRELQPIAFADSDQVRVGDIVFAVGSPFGYTHTVTSGIVSAKHRRLEMGQAYEDYLQTDAAINPGNSGGALVNLRGELVGVNSAMVSGSRTNDGVGLAIASNLVKWVQERLIRDGEVHRGFLGINILEPQYEQIANWDLMLNPTLRGVTSQEELLRRLGLKEAAGAMIVAVHAGGPAHSGGLKVMDVLTEIDGRPIRTVNELVWRVVELEPGKVVRLKFIRDRKAQDAMVTLNERPPNASSRPPVRSPVRK
jgi:S1-C subfamily serine protease